MTTLFPSLTVLLLITAITAADAQAGNSPALLPAGLAPAGLRLQATFAAARPDQGMAVFGQHGQTSLHRAGTDLGNGLQLLRILTDRVVLSHGSREYFLPLRPAASDERRPPALPGKRQAAATGMDPHRASHTGSIRSGGQALQADNLDDVRQQCRSSVMSQLSAAQQQEIQALGLCP